MFSCGVKWYFAVWKTRRQRKTNLLDKIIFCIFLGHPWLIFDALCEHHFQKKTCLMFRRQKGVFWDKYENTQCLPRVQRCPVQQQLQLLLLQLFRNKNCNRYKYRNDCNHSVESLSGMIQIFLYYMLQRFFCGLRNIAIINFEKN